MAKCFDDKKIFANINWILNNDIYSDINPIKLPNNITCKVVLDNYWDGYKYKDDIYSISIRTQQDVCVLEFVFDDIGIIFENTGYCIGYNPDEYTYFSKNDIDLIYNNYNVLDAKLLNNKFEIIDNKIEINILINKQINKKIIKLFNKVF